MIDLVVPAYTIDDEGEQMLVACLESFKPHVDRIIVIEDGGRLNEKAALLSDTYIRVGRNHGFTATVNLGWRFSTGDFTMIANSDTKYREGNLRDLCQVQYITSPRVHLDPGNGYSALSGCFWCVPRALTDRFGYLDESMKHWCSDYDYGLRVRDCYRYMPKVVIEHRKAGTYSKVAVVDSDDHHVFAIKYKHITDPNEGIQTIQYA